MSNEYTREDVAKHNKEDDAWVIIDSVVYDISNFAAMHPGGELVLLAYAGKDITPEFYSLHRQQDLIKFHTKLKIGVIGGETPKIPFNQFEKFSKIMYTEHPSVQGFTSPYYTEKHMKYRTLVRKFVNEHLLKDALECEDTGARPSKDLIQLMGAEGYLAARLGPGKHLKGRKLPGGLQPEEYDYFYEAITHEEFVRVSCRGYADGNGGGMVIGLPPVFNFGTPEMITRVVDPVLRGEKYICLAISEAFAGSDVASIKTTAVKSSCGKFFIVNGTKKWITGGMYADYFSTAVRTSKGISMLLIERGKGVRTKPIKTSYSSTAGTAYVIFENVQVPVENLLGKEDHGFQVVMSNFNHERWVMCVASTRATKYVIEECFKWANQRKVFGKPLIAQPVVRQKLAEMVALNESCTHWVDHVTNQMNKLSYAQQAKYLAGPIALLKYQVTRTAHIVSDHAVQIFGGRGITKTGMGRVIEMFQRSYKFDAILGGSEEILADLGIKQALRNYPQYARL